MKTEQAKLVEGIMTKGGERKTETLEWQDRFTRGTGYVDSIRVEDMTAAVMTGETPNGKPFVAVRATRIVGGRLVKGVTAFFQRYEDNTYTWTSGGLDALHGHVLLGSERRDTLEAYNDLDAWRLTSVIE